MLATNDQILFTLEFFMRQHKKKVIESHIILKENNPNSASAFDFYKNLSKKYSK